MRVPGRTDREVLAPAVTLVSVLLSMLTVLVVMALPAAAYYTTRGSGQRTMSITPVDGAQLTATLLPDRALWPGVPTSVRVVLTNPTAEPVRLAGFGTRPVEIAGKGARVCPASAFTLRMPSVPDGFITPGRTELRGQVMLSPDAPGTCQGVRSSIEWRLETAP